MTWGIVAAACGLAYWRGSVRWVVYPLLFLTWLVMQTYAWELRLLDRWDTYRLAFRISLEHPWVGIGAGPIALPVLCRIWGLPLPGPHSELLALAILHGWPVTLLTIWMAWQALRRPSSGLRRLAQAGLCGLLIYACGRTAVVIPGYVLALTLCSVYLLKERT